MMSRATKFRIAWLAVALIGMPLYWAANPPRRPLDIADGAYWNACCGSITLKHGTMTLQNDETSYVVEYDKGGDYVLPSHLVGVRKGYLFVDRDREPLKIRLEISNQLRFIEIHTDPNYPDDNIYQFTAQRQKR